MADWGWERVEQFPGVSPGPFGGIHLAVQDNKLWAAAYAGTIYYSSNGTDYTVDPLGSPGSPILDTITFNDKLYAVTPTSLYRRDPPSGWTKVADFPGVAPAAWSAWADDTAGCIMIGGREGDESEAEARIWRYSQSDGISTDFTSDIPDEWAIAAVCYSTIDLCWYAAPYRTWTESGDPPAVRRRVEANNWVSDFAWDANNESTFKRFGVFRTGTYIWHQDVAFNSPRRALYKPPGGSWGFIEHSISGAVTSYTHSLFYGWEWGDHLLTVRSTNTQGNVYYRILNNAGEETWATTGLIVLPNVEDIIGFGTCLYAACNDSPNYAIWRACAKNRLGTGRPGDARSLVVDHEYGDTIYLGLLDEDNKPMIMWVDWDFADHQDPPWVADTGGSWVGVNTPETRNICIGYGNMDGGWTWNRQVVISPPWRKGSFWGAGRFGDSEVVTTLEPHPTAGSADLVATRRDNQDWIKSSFDEAFSTEIWTDMGDIPFVARSQLRVNDDIWIGSDTGGSSVVRLLTGGSGNDWVDKSVGLPNVPINDLELGF